ncbi:MAG: hypothetical protein WC565_03575 [Parcubacteria group bacterium]
MVRCCSGTVQAVNTIVDTSLFVSILGPSDTDVQRALETIDGLPLGENAVLYVSKTGDDATAVRGLMSRPYATVERALIDAQNYDVIKLGPGNFVETSLTIPDTLTRISIVGSGRGVTTLGANPGYLGRTSATALLRFRLADLTYRRSSGDYARFDGSASADGYCNSVVGDNITIENVDDISTGIVGVGWSFVRCGYVRLQNVSFVTDGGTVDFTNCGEVRMRNVLKSGTLTAADVFNIDASGTLPTGFTRMLFALYSAKITETTINASSPALDFTTDASCEITGSVLNFRPDAVSAEELDIYVAGRMDDSQINIGADTATSTTPIHAELANVTMSPNVVITGSDNVDINANVKNSDVDSITATESYADGTISINADGTRTDSVVLNATLGTIDSEFVNSRVPEMPTVSGNTSLVIRGTTTGAEVNKGWTAMPISWSYNAGTGYIDTETDPRMYLAEGMPIRFFMPGGEFVGSESVEIITATALTNLENVINEPSGRLYFDVVETAVPGTYRIDIYANAYVYKPPLPAGADLANLVGHTADFTVAGTYAVVADNGSGMGGTITVNGASENRSSWEFFRWGIVKSLEAGVIEWWGCAIDATAAFMWYADASRVVQFSSFVSGAGIAADATLLQTKMSQYPVWGVGYARAIRQEFRPSAVTVDGVLVRWYVFDRTHSFGGYGNLFSTATTVDVAGRPVTSELDSAYTEAYNRLQPGDILEMVTTVADAGDSVDNLWANLICVLE